MGKELTAQRDTLAQLQEEYEGLTKQVNMLGKIPESSATAATIFEVNARSIQIEARLSELEKALGETPAKAIAILLLQKDIQSLQEKYENELASTRASVDRVYDQNKWFLGVVCTMALSVFLSSISTVLKQRNTREES